MSARGRLYRKLLPPIQNGHPRYGARSRRHRRVDYKSDKCPPRTGLMSNACRAFLHANSVFADTSIAANRGVIMKSDRFDAIIMGTVPAGKPLALGLGGAGRRTAMVERNMSAARASMSDSRRQDHGRPRRLFSAESSKLVPSMSLRPWYFGTTHC